MDQLKVFLAVVEKHQFWVLCGVMLLTTLVCWWLATSSLAEQYQNRVKQIKGDLDGTKVPPNQPNQGVIDKIGEQHTSLKQNVFSAWKILHDQQKEKNPLPAVLGDDFKQEFENLGPQGQLDSIYRGRYQAFIKDHLPSLMKMIDVRRPVDDTGAAPDAAAPRGIPAGQGIPGMPPGMPAGGPGRGIESDKMVGTVDWKEEDQAPLWNRFQWTDEPSTADVVLAQEDLWVYEALLRVIKNVNKSATSQTNASVKRINKLEIGRNSRQAWKESQETVFRMGRGGGPSSMTPPGSERMPPPTSPDAASAAGGSADKELFLDRYVDEKGQPLPVQDAAPYVSHPYAEFKMMPIHLNLLIDQQSLPTLLVECANSNMPIEVRRVRILKQTFEPFDMEAQPTKGPGNMPGRKRGPMRARAPGAATGGMSGQDVGGELDVPVDIYAIIYIYNPPDRAKLGTGTASAIKPGEAPAPGTPPAAPDTPPAAPGTPPAGDAPAKTPAPGTPPAGDAPAKTPAPDTPAKSPTPPATPGK